MKYSIYSKLMFILLLSVFVTACEDDDDAPVACNTIAITGGNEQVIISEGTVSDPLQVTVTNADGQPLANVAVTWAVASGGGTVAPATSTTNAQGIAETVWTFGADNGTVRASIENPASCTSTNTVDFTAQKIQLTLNQTGTSITPVGLNTAGTCYNFDYVLAFTSNVDLSDYYIDVKDEYQFSTQAAIDSFFLEGVLSTDGRTITYRDCFTFEDAEYLDDWFTVSLFNMEDIVEGEPTIDAVPVVTSNRIGPFRTNRPEGSPRLAGGTKKSAAGTRRR